MAEEQEIGEIFLSGFVRELIYSSKPAPETIQTEKFYFETKEKTAEPESKKRIIEMLPEFITPIKNIGINQNNLGMGTKSRKISGQRSTPSRRIKETNSPAFQQNTQTLLQTDINERPTAEKLNFLIKDPAVTEIECTDAGQPLLVKKAGTVQRTRVKLSIEEIYQLIAEFSQKARIPVIEGTFKAALNNLILTAILSETLGPRFIMQKKNPFQQLVPNS